MWHFFVFRKSFKGKQSLRDEYDKILKEATELKTVLSRLKSENGIKTRSDRVDRLSNALNQTKILPSSLSLFLPSHICSKIADLSEPCVLFFEVFKVFWLICEYQSFSICCNCGSKFPRWTSQFTRHNKPRVSDITRKRDEESNLFHLCTCNRS